AEVDVVLLMTHLAVVAHASERPVVDVALVAIEHVVDALQDEVFVEAGGLIPAVFRVARRALGPEATLVRIFVAKGAVFGEQISPNELALVMVRRLLEDRRGRLMALEALDLQVLAFQVVARLVVVELLLAGKARLIVA